MKNRILIVSHNPFSKTSNNGKTLEAIFSKFKKEELAQLYFRDKEADLTFANSYYFMSDSDAIKSLFKAKNFEHKTNNLQKSISSFDLVGFLGNFNHSLAIFRDILWDFAKPIKTENFNKWIKDLHPNFIFYIGGNQVFSHKLVQSLAKDYGIPYAVYFTDDYVIFPKQNNILQKIQRKRLIKAYRKTIKNADICFAIGNMMCQHYESFFEKKFLPIMNMTQVNRPIIKEVNNEKFIISYFGGLHLNRWKQLAEFSNELNPHNFELRVYSTASMTAEIRQAFVDSNVKFMGGVKGLDLEENIANSNALIHVESNDETIKGLTKLSISTKIPEYLNTNKLVIAFGPSDIASIKIIEDNNIGLVIHDKEEIKNKLQEFVFNPTKIKDISERARNFARENFDINQKSEDFKNLILKKIYY